MVQIIVSSVTKDLMIYTNKSLTTTDFKKRVKLYKKNGCINKYLKSQLYLLFYDEVIRFTKLKK